MVVQSHEIAIAFHCIIFHSVGIIDINLHAVHSLRV